MITPYHLFNSKVKLERRQITKDEGQGVVVVPMIDKFVKCKITYDSERLATGTPGRQTQYNLTIFVAPNEDIIEGDRITIDYSTNPTIYRVSSIVNEAEMSVFKRLQLERVT